MDKRQVDLKDVLTVCEAEGSRLGGNWAYQGDGEGKLSALSDAEGAPGVALDYTFTAESQVHVAVNVSDVSFASPWEALQLDVHGDGSENLLKAVFEDGLGGFYEYTCGPIDWQGWRTVDVPFPGADVCRFALDEATKPDKVWTQLQRKDTPVEPPSLPLRLHQIKLVWAIDRTVALERKQAGIPEDEILRGVAKETSGRIALRNLRATLIPDELDGIRATAGTDHVGNLFASGQECYVDLAVTNASQEARAFDVKLLIEDFDANVVEHDAGEFRVRAGCEKDLRVELPELANGWYQVTAKLSAGRATRRARTDIGVATQPLVPQEQANDFFGLNAHIDRDGSVRSLEQMELASLVGATVLRRGTRQFQVNPAEGVFDWSYSDRVLGYPRQYGLKTMYHLHGGAAWCSEATINGINHRSRPSAYGAYVHEIVKRYGQEIRDFEIWNEPNLKMFWRGDPDPLKYLELLKAAWEGAKSANPNVRILGPSMSGPYSPMDRNGVDFNYLRTFLDNGGYDYLDVLSMHTYTWVIPGYENALPTTLDAVVELAGNYGPAKPLYLTEVGVQAPLTWGACSLRDCARYAARYLIHCLAHPSVETVLWYELSQGYPSHQGDYSMTCPETLAARPELMTYRVLAAELGDVTSCETLVREDKAGEVIRTASPHGDEGQAVNPIGATFVYRFAGPRGQVLAAWSGKAGTKLAIEADNAEMVDIMGRRSAAGLRVELSAVPVLIRAEKINATIA